MFVYFGGARDENMSMLRKPLPPETDFFEEFFFEKMICPHATVDILSTSQTMPTLSP